MSNRIDIQVGSSVPHRPLSPNIYYRNSLGAQTIHPSKKVTLSSNTEGTGPLVIDDLLILKVNTQEVLRLDFRDNDKNELRAMDPVDITEVLRPFFGQQAHLEIEYLDMHGIEEYATPVYIRYEAWDVIYSSVFTMENGTYVFYYTTESLTRPGYTPSGIFCYGSKHEEEGMVPIYVFSARTRDKAQTEFYFYSRDESPLPGYEARGVAFYAFGELRPNTLPIYGYRIPVLGEEGLWAYMLTFENQNYDNCENLGPQFYVPV